MDNGHEELQITVSGDVIRKAVEVLPEGTEAKRWALAVNEDGDAQVVRRVGNELRFLSGHLSTSELRLWTQQNGCSTTKFCYNFAVFNRRGSYFFMVYLRTCKWKEFSMKGVS